MESDSARKLALKKLLTYVQFLLMD